MNAFFTLAYRFTYIKVDTISAMSLSHHIYSDPQFATQYANSIIDNAWNACYERPGTLSLLPENIVGKQVLDAGCGPGIVAKELWERGAVVTAIDYSEKMIALTNERTSGHVSTMVRDLNKGLSCFEDNYFDLIYCSLVIHYLDDLNFIFSEFARVLTAGGLIIFSTDHPENPALQGKELSQQQLNSVYWKGYDVYMELYHRPWHELESALKQNHFDIDTVITPQPIDACQNIYPEEYAFLTANPHFICVRARKNNIS
jgi:SAM-dependent methyltransferase